tara:strand:- start:1879 stop:3453 length:1575 start_codon:yes stop_codon:yes gene_type:complete
VKHRFLPSLFSVVLLYSPSTAAEKDIVLLYTNNTNGALENCLCPEKAYGSLEKRVHYLREWLKENPNSVLVDAGDFLSASRNALKDSIAFRIYEMMAYDAIGLGDQEFFKGTQFITDLIEGSSLPFISSNLDKPTLSSVKRDMVVERGGVRFGFLSVMDPSVFMFYPKRVRDELAYNDFSSTLQGEIDAVSKKSDVVILLSHSGVDADREIAKTYSGIDVIVGGHTQTVMETPEVVGETIIVQAGKDGYYVGHLRLTFDDNNRITAHEGELVAIDFHFPNDPTVVDMIIGYNRISKARAGSVVERITPVPLEFMVASSESCASCHATEYDHWKASRHAVSLKTLKDDHKEKSLDCLSCHTSGFGRNDGYLNYNITAALSNVNCTECHYTPTGHLAEPAAFVTTGLAEENCVRCHDQANSPTFAFAAFMDRSRHPLPPSAVAPALDDRTAIAEVMTPEESVDIEETGDEMNLVHTVRAGESLWSLSEEYLGDGRRWREIYEANPALLSYDPNQLPVGMKLRIPPQ